MLGGPALAEPGGPNPPQPLTVFAAGSFAESLAVRGGDLYVSVGVAGEVVRVSATGVQSRYAAGLPIGGRLITGLAFDGAGNLYVGAATFSADPAPGVFVVPRGGGSLSRVLTLPAGSFPNGLAVRGGSLYVSDSDLGAIWRMKLSSRGAAPAAPWYENALLAPVKGLGANGIAFDAAGNLYVAVNTNNRLYRLRLWSGELTRLADRSDGLSYPTQPAFDTVAGSTRLNLTNGAFANGIADVETLDAGVQGLPLP